MQRRKLTINFENRPRLVIERQSVNQKTLVPSNLPNKKSQHKFIAKKQNDHVSNKLIPRNSSQKFPKIEQMRIKDNRLSCALTIKSQNTNTIHQHQIEAIDRTTFIQDIINKVINPHLGSLTHHKLRVLLQIILAQGFKRINSFNQIQNRIFRKLQANQTIQQQDAKRIKNKMTFQNIINQKFIFQNPHSFVIQSRLINYDLRVRKQENKSEGVKFMSEHIKQIKTYILNKEKMDASQNKLQKYEEQLFNFAQELSISRFGACKYIPSFNLSVTQQHIDKEIIKLQSQINFNKQHIQANYNPLIQIKQSYRNIIQELLQAIDQRTEFSKKMVFKILQWQQNYLQRKQNLNKLKVNYCERLAKIAKILAVLEEQANLEQRQQLTILEEHISAISRLFLLGNTLY